MPDAFELLEEKQLVERAKRDSEAFGVLFERHYAKIFSYILRRVGHVAAAEDIASETFQKALAKLWQFKWRNVPFSAWMYRIASNEVKQHFRRKSRHEETSLTVLMEENGFEPISPLDFKQELEQAEAEVERHELFLQMRAHVEQLPSAYQEAIALRFFEEKKIEEIAVILGKKTGTIKSLLSRGLEKLRDAMQPSQASGISYTARSTSQKAT